jgi:hypothetical protein
MKQTLILVIIGFLVLAVAYWWLHQSSSPSVPIDDAVVMPTPDEYVGLSLAEAVALADQNGVPFRVVVIDGEPQMVTEDYVPGRINAAIEDDVVVSYEVEGFGIETEVIDIDHSVIIGMTLTEAEDYAIENDIMFRIGFQDGEPLGVTMDYRPGRITVEVMNDIITGYSVE